MNLPPDLLTVTASVATNAAPNTTSTTVLLAAPGAGLRYRVWAVNFGCLPSNTGAIWTFWGDTTGAVSLANLTRPANTGDHAEFPGGVALPDNTGIRVVHRSNVASQDLRVVALYTLETP